MTTSKHDQKTDKPAAAKEPNLALITARTLSDHMARNGQGKHAAELDEAIKAAEPKRETAAAD